MRLCHLVTLAASGALGSIVTAQTFAQTGAGTTGNGIVVGIVVAMGRNAPLPYADVVIETLRCGTFADSLGRFRLTGLPSFTGMRGPRVPFERQQLLELRFLRDIPSTMTAVVNRPTRP